MFQETKEGQTHSFGDGCGEPEHNKPEKWEEKFDSMFDLDGYGDSHIVQEKVKSFIRGVVFQREKEIAEKVENYQHYGFCCASCKTRILNTVTSIIKHQ